MIDWSQTFKDLLDTKTPPGVLFMGVLFTLAAWLGGRAVRLAVHRLLDRSQSAGADPTGIRFLGQLARLMVYIFAFVCYAHVVPALEKFGGVWLTSVGVVSVVVGLAAQSTLGNLISGISLVLYRPFKIGDRLKVSLPNGTETGVVESIDLGYTVLRAADKRRIIIPNNSMASQPCINLSLLPPRTPCDVSLYVASGADLNQGSKILLELAKAHKKIAQVDGCRVTRVTAKGTILTLAASCEEPDDAPGVKSDLLRSAKEQFDAAGLKIV
jgi:small-conductance mechanosensitive channel